MSDVVMPRLSDSMEEGTILKWLKSDGDTVARGEELVEIETDKATMTYEADADGALAIVAQEGETLPIGAKIATIGAPAESGGGAKASESKSAKADGDDAETGGERATATATEEAPAEEQDADAEAPEDEAETPEEDEDDEDEDQDEEDDEPGDEPAEEQPAAKATDKATKAAADSHEAPPADANGGRAKASPVARRIARERGVDISTLQGSGPGGRIVKADVEAAAGDSAPASEPAPAAAATATQPEPAAATATQPEPVAATPAATAAETGTAKGDVTVEELSRIQQLIARRMAESKATVPEFTITIDVDMEACVELRAQLKKASGADGAAPSYNDMVVKASALALREFPRANGSYKDGRFELYSRVNVGVAVAANDTLIVPTVFDADGKSLGEIARETRALADKVRSGQIAPPDLSGGTFTVSNLGMFGISHFTAVINSPQAAILAVGKMEPRAVVRDGAVVARSTMTMTLACDHRILYGADAAEFLGRIRTLLEQPVALAL